MNRRGFLRLLGLSAGVVSVPVVLSGVDVKFQTKTVPAEEGPRMGFYEGFSYVESSPTTKAHMLRNLIFDDPVLTEAEGFPPVEVFEPACEFEDSRMAYILSGLAFPPGSGREGPYDGRYFHTLVSEERLCEALNNLELRRDIRREIHESTAMGLYSRASWNQEALNRWYRRHVDNVGLLVKSHG